MTNEEIIELACQTFDGIIKKGERKNFLAFAKLVAEKEREKVTKERDKACATLRKTRGQA